MTRKTLGLVALWGALGFGGYAGTATGQGWNAPPIGSVTPASYGTPANPCACSTPVPQVSAAICTPQQVTHVAVTEIHECRQTVQRPVVEQQLVDHQVTELHPVVETQTAQIPTVSYQTVTECQTRTRDAGQWIKTYQANPRVSPCEYDPRPGLSGWLNRTGYSIRMAFTPAVTAQHQYVPNVITESVPVTRQIAIPGTRQVAYQVTKMVPVTTTRKVAVNSVRMVAQEVVTKHPVTVMRPVGSLGTQSALLQPSPSSSTPVTSQLAPASRVPQRTATRPQGSSGAGSDEMFDSKDRSDDIRSGEAPAKNGQGKFIRPTRRDTGDAESEVAAKSQPSVHTTGFRPTNTAVRANQWVASRRPAPAAGPALPEENITVAETKTKKLNK